MYVLLKVRKIICAHLALHLRAANLRGIDEITVENVKRKIWNLQQEEKKVSLHNLIKTVLQVHALG